MSYPDLSPEAYERSLTRYRHPEPLSHQEPLVTRICLKCNIEFPSHGDRICPRCNEVNRRGGRRVEKGGTSKSRAGHAPGEG